MPIPASPCFIPAEAPATSLVLRPIPASRTLETKVPRRGLVPKQLLPSGRTMLDSLCVRLTLWYSAVLAVVLVALSVFTYFIFWHSSVQLTDADRPVLADAFVDT